MKRRNFFLLIALLPAMAWADVGDEFAADGLKYKVTSESPKTVELTGYGMGDVPTGDFVIPTTVNGYSVTSIGNFALRESSGLTSVIIPETVTTIGNSAFNDCDALTSVTIPTSVTSIKDYAFCNCFNLTSVILPEGVKSIGEKAFSRCESLPSITIPASVTSIGRLAFQCCIRLTSINVAADNEHYMSYDGVLFDKGMKSILAYPEGKTATSYTIPEGVTSIGDFAFYFEVSNTHGYEEGKRLTSIVIPEGVTSIGWLSFGWCDGLTSITIPASMDSIGVGSFFNCTGLKSIIFADNSHLMSIDGSAFGGCTGLTSMTIPEGVISIGSSAFRDCINLKTITIPASMTDISSDVFFGSKNVTDIYCYANPSVLKWPSKKGLFSEKSGLMPDKQTKCHVTGEVAVWEKNFPTVNVTFVGDLAEGIESLTAGSGKGNAVYNLAGQRIGGLMKGINIVDGKKVMVK
jgi:hypothetical protein